MTTRRASIGSQDWHGRGHLTLAGKAALFVLRPARQWFKIAGGAKAQVVEEALSLAPAGACLEIGTYVGFDWD
ncbi:unnamed protein product [Effrenium voratum]|nr:unnamed protein product [Effrenium voratum]